MTFHKYPKIYVIGHSENQEIFSEPEDEIIVEEKIDGANFRFFITKEGTVVYGSRTQELHEDKDHQYQKNFNRCIKHIQEQLKDKDLTPYKGLIFYGENCVKHTLDYGWENIPPFLGFDVYCLKCNKFKNYQEKVELFEALDLDIVPIVSICNSKDVTQIDDNIVPQTKYPSPSSDDLQAEGIVFKNYDKQIFAKYVREKFKEANRKVFGGNKKHAKTDDEYFTAVYCTNPRIEKMVFRLIDEGRPLGMELMGNLVKMTYKDIWEENWNEISSSKKKIDLHKFKQLVSKRCLEVLKQMITNNALNGEENKS